MHVPAAAAAAAAPLLLLMCVAATAPGAVRAKTMPQAQRVAAVEATGEAVVQKDCVDNGRMYHLQEQFERTYHGRALRCTCLGGQALDCEAVQQPSGEQVCFDQYTGRRYSVGETWERPRKGMVWDCTCLGAGIGRISCSTENRCHDQGQSYRLGERWKRPHSTDGQMLECVCLGNGKGEWTCNPVAGAAERCYDSVLGSSFAVGEDWERPYHTWMIVDCTCLGGGLGQVSCSSKNRCNDQDSQSSYRVGETWTKTDAAGDLLHCVCTGNGRGEWKCEVHSTAVAAVHTGEFAGVEEAQFRPSAQCELDNGATYATGQQWLKMQGTDRMLCTCLGNGVSCQTSGVMTYGGNAPGEPCVFPFMYTGLSYTACVGEGRSDGKLWCSTTGNYDQDRKYTFCRSESAVIQTRGGNSHGALCHFPFQYNQRSYTECTAEGRPDAMKWCSTTEHYDEDRKFGFCPMEAHEEVCSSQGVQYRVGDQWDKRHQMGHMMRCTCNGNGRGEWNCIPYAQLLDRCVVDETEYNVNQTFSRKHAEGHMMNCTCFGQGRGRWACDPIDQCQDLELMQFYQIGETWNKLYKGTAYICGCYGNSVGEWNCRPQTTEIASNNPVQVTIKEDNKHRHSQQLQWTNTQGRPVNWYFLKWRLKGSQAPWKEARVPAQRNTYVITGLRPGMVYEGQLITQFSHGATAISKFEFSTASVPLTPWEGERERLPGTEQRVSDAVTEVTSNSFVVAWASAGEVMSGYRVEYELTEDSSSREIINLPGTATSITLDSLLPGREYTVTVIELGARGLERIILTTTQTTAPDAPENYSIDEVTESTIVIRWRLPSAQVSAFRIIYLPNVDGGESTDLHLPPDVTRARLVDLLAGHTYNISVFSVAEDLESPPLFMQVSTRGSAEIEQRPPLPPSDLTFVTVGETKATLTWAPPPSAEVRGYRVVATAAPGQGRVPTREVTVTSDLYAEVGGLLPGHTYRFQVFAVYPGGGESPPLQGEQSTKLDAPRDVRFVEVGETSVTAAWRAPRGPIAGYLVRCEPTDGGEPLERQLGADVASFTVDGLRAGSEYVVTVYALARGDQERSPGVSGIVSTQSVREMSEFVIEVTESTIVVSWNSVPRLSIKVRVAPVEGGGDAREFESDSGRLLIEDLTPGVDYTVTIRVLVDGQPRGQPIQRHVTTALPPPTEIKVETNGNPGELQVSWESSEVQAITAYRVTCVADGHGGSRQVLEEVVSPQHNYTVFEHLLPGVQYNVSVYAVGMDAESFPTSTVSLPEIPPPKGLRFSEESDTSVTMQWQHPNLPNVAGYRLTVAAPSSSSDHGSPHVDSAGRPVASGRRPQHGGAAGGEPLLSLQLGPDAERYTVNGLEPGIDYHFSLATVTEQGQSLPAAQWHSTAVPPPTSLRFSHVREDGFRLSWSPPGTLTTPAKFLVRCRGHGGDRADVDVAAGSSTAVLSGLQAGTEYQVFVHTLLDGQESVALTGTQYTAPDAPTGLQFSHVTPTAFTVEWRASLAPVEGYRVRFGREGHTDPREEWVPTPGHSASLSGLAPGEQYTVAVYALSSSRLESRPLTGRQITPVDSPTNLQVTSQSATSFLVSWTPPTTYVSNYIVSYHYGRQPERQVTVSGRESSVLVEDLQPGAEYSVSLRAVTERGDQPAGEALTTTHATGIDGPTDVEAVEVRDTSILLRWAAPRAPVQGYRVSCSPTGGHGGAPIAKTLSRGQSEVTIDSLSPTTEYLIQVVALGFAQNSEATSITVQTGVDRPRGLTFRDVGVDSMVASWQAPEGRVTGYRVTFQGAGDEDGGFSREVLPAPGPGADSVIVGGLRPGQEYTVRVFALNGHRESVPLTGTQITAIPPPTALEFPEVGADSVAVRWSAPRPDAGLTGVRVVFEPRSRKASRKEISEGPRATATTVTGLTAGVDYAVSVYAVKDALTSKPLQGTVRTVESIPAPSKVSVTETHAGSVTLEWRSRPDPLTGFLIVVQPAAAGAGGRPAEHTVPPGARTFTVTGLQPGVRYVISIYAVRGGRRSQPVTVTTATAVDSPTGLKRVTSSEDSLTLGWTRPRASITGYLLTCQAARGGPAREHRPDVSATQYTITDLQSNTEYVFSLVAVQDTVRSQPLRGSFRTAEAVRPELLATPAPRPPIAPAKVPAGRELPSRRGDTSPLSSETRFEGREMGPWAGQRHVETIVTELRPGASLPSHQAGMQLQVDGVALVAPAVLAPEVHLEQHLTETEVTWVPRHQASEYLVSCIPVGAADGTAPIQMRLPGSLSSTTLTGLMTGTQYSVVVEALHGSRRDKVLEEFITLLNTVPMNLTGDATEDRCMDEDTGRDYAVGEEWERPSNTGFLFLCRCLGHGSGHIRCDSSKWCHDNGQNYRIGEQWSTTTATGRRMSCTCLGNDLGQFKCEPDENTCYEGGKEYTVGQKWMRKNRGLDCTCTCYGGRRGYRCDCGAVQNVASSLAQGHTLHQIRNQLLRRPFPNKCTFQC
ncbi:LOW QUALITY PROTEIN: fibronectin-like [Lethenteron reissneri]|uniref:LOW QUALITY PROTEIN: fibronectin-like n=1 Tax=Lethenteron reissneri TaxID=7753 RepID=UPI002AB66C2B|nr:LOW QUALITY PROTEIN: fibronectin-like [Lethenteron reissneri]